MDIGIFPGKFLPPHKGHLNAIEKASNNCDKLYVIVCHQKSFDDKCTKVNFPTMSLKTRVDWLKNIYKDNDKVCVLGLNEDGMPPYPLGWEVWSNAIRSLVKEPINCIFGSENEYLEGYARCFPEAIYTILDNDRIEFPISATMIRENPKLYQHYLIEEARDFYEKTAK